jgi:hypothetical protein
VQQTWQVSGVGRGQCIGKLRTIVGELSPFLSPFPMRAWRQRPNASAAGEATKQDACADIGAYQQRQVVDDEHFHSRFEP